MMGKRTRYGADFQAKVALEAIRGELTISQLATRYSVHQTMINDWTRMAVAGLVSIFDDKGVERKLLGTARWRNCTPKSANCWWNAIFWRKPPVDEPRAEAADG